MIPRATPVAAPVIKPRMATLVTEGLLPTNRKPAAAIHKVQITMRMFMGLLLTAAGCLSRHLPGRSIASNTLGGKTDQKLSEERAAAVARYFYEVQNIPMRRILMPVGYGSTHRLANNTDVVGRELNRRVDVKVLVNKSLEEGL